MTNKRSGATRLKYVSVLGLIPSNVNMEPRKENEGHL